MTIFDKYYMIVIRQGGEWICQKVLNIHNSLKKMLFSIERIILNCRFVKQPKILGSANPLLKIG